MRATPQVSQPQMSNTVSFHRTPRTIRRRAASPQTEQRGIPSFIAVPLSGESGTPSTGKNKRAADIHGPEGDLVELNGIEPSAS